VPGGDVERVERGVVADTRLDVIVVGFEDVGLAVFPVAEGPCDGLARGGGSIADGGRVVADGVDVGAFVEGHVGVLC